MRVTAQCSARVSIQAAFRRDAEQRGFTRVAAYVSAGAIEMTEVIEKKGKKKKRGKSTRSEVSKKMITRNVRTVV